MGIVEELARFVCQADVDALPQMDRDILRRHVADVVAASIVGERCAEGIELLTVYGGSRTPEAVAGRAGLVRLTEMDDIHFVSNTTPSAVSVSVALALAAQIEVDPRRVENAIFVGTEILVRFGKAIDGARALLKGFWPTRNAATLASSAVAAKIFDLSPAATLEALSLALTMTNGRSGRFYQEPSGRWVIFAAAVSAGIRCVLAARAGFNGGPTPPTAEWLSTTLGTEFNGAVMTEKLGLGSVYPELSLKPYGTARQSLSAAEAMRDLVRQGLDPADIQMVQIRVPSGHVAMIGQSLDPHVRASSFVSVSAQVATAALMPQELYDVERYRVLSDAGVFSLAKRCTVVGDVELDRLFPEVWGARIDVTTSSGLISRTVLEPQGSPANRMTDDQVLAKARSMLDHVGEAGRAEDILGLTSRAFVDRHELSLLAEILVGANWRG